MALLLCAWLFSSAAYAEIYSGNCGANGANVTWTLDTGTGVLEISGTGAMADFASYYGITYPWSEYLTFITSVKIGDDITSIGNHAFHNCTGLTSVTIPESVTNIGDYAFYGCTRLNSITIPDSVTTIGDYAFYGCTRLSSITIPNSVTTIGNEAFRNCTGLTSITIPDSVTTIGNYAFYGCTVLTSVTIPESVTAIGASAFYDCTRLKKVHISDLDAWWHIKFSYGSNPLYYAHNLYLNDSLVTELTIPEDITTIDDRFQNCTSITSVTIPNSVTSIGNSAFAGCTGLKSVSSKVDSVGSFAFYGCTALDTLELPYVKYIDGSSNQDNIGIYTCTGLKKLDIGSAEHLPAGFLSNLTQLEDLTIPYIGAGSKNEATGKNGLLGALFSTKSVSGMKAVEQYYNETKAITSYLPTGLRKLTITDSCEELPYGALYNVSTLREVILPASLYMVGEKAFYGCAGIEHLYCRGAAPAGCYENAFTGMRLATCVLHVPHNSVELYQRSDGWKNFYFIQGEEPIRIDVVKNIAHAGIVTGLTEYALYDEALLTAIAHSGYRFVSWMEDGSEICTQESYRFRAESNRNLTAVFMPVFNENDVEITPSAHTASLTWETEEGVDEYSLTLYSDAAMTDTVQTIRLDIAAQKVRATAMSSIEVENLDAETEYYYVLTGISADGTIASQKTGSFKTTESASDALKETQQADEHITVYNLQGVLVLETDDATDLKTLQNGAYIVNGKKMIIAR